MADQELGLDVVSSVVAFSGSTKATLEAGRRLRVPAGQRRPVGDGDRVKVGPVYLGDQVDGEPDTVTDADLDPYGIRCVGIYPMSSYLRLEARLRARYQSGGPRTELLYNALGYLRAQFDETQVGAGGRVDLGDQVEALGLREPWEVFAVGDGDRLLVMSPADYRRRRRFFARSEVVRDVNALLQSVSGDL
jgi:hypothetical protein